MNTIQAALAKIGNLARQKFGDNEGFIQNNKVTFQPIRQAVSSPTNLAYTTGVIASKWFGLQQAGPLSKLFTGNPLTRQQFTQAVQPIAKAYTKLPRGVQKFGEGFYEGNTLGLSDMNVPASTNWGEKLAYGSGYTASMLNPYNPINKIAGALGGTQTVMLLQKPMGQFAGNLIARGGGMKLLGRGIANVAQGIPYTAAYAGVNLLNRKPQDVANDAIQNAAGDLLLGGTPLVGGLLIKSGAGRKLKSAKTVATTATKKLVQEASDIPSNLLTEAKKYKSVDEFVNSSTKLTYKNLQENPYSIKAYGKDFNEPVEYHRAGIIKKKGDIWLTDNPAGASQYSSAGGGTKTGSYIVQSKNPLIIDAAGGKYANGNIDISKILTPDELKQGYTNNPTLKQKFIDYAKNNGYDAVQFADSFPDGEGGMRSLVVWDKSAIKTKSQLTSLYNQATKGTQATDLLSEARKYKSAEEFVSGFAKKSDPMTYLKARIPEIDKIEGNYIYTKDGNRIELAMNKFSDGLEINAIQADKKGTGIGSKIVNGLKEWTESRLGTIKINKAYNSKFWDKAGFTGPDEYSKGWGAGDGIDKTFLQGRKSQLTDIYNQAKGQPTIVKESMRSRIKPPDELYGGVAGVEMYQDENGEWKIRYDPVKGAMGVVGMTATKGMMKQNNLQKAVKAVDSSQIESIIQEGKKSIGKLSEPKNKSIRQIADSLYTQWVDRFHPISQATNQAKKQLKAKGAQLRPEYDPEVIVRRLTGAGGIADTQYKRELKPIVDKMDQFGIGKDDMDVYLAHKRMAGFGDVGREVYGVDPIKSREIVNALETKYGEAIKSISDELYAYQDRALKELSESGFLSPQALQTIKSQNPNYSPLYRVMDEMDNYLGVPTRKTMQGTSPIQKIKGSDRQIVSPIESIIANTFRNRAAIEKNRVAKSIVNLQEIAPELGFKKVAKPAADTITVWNQGKKEYWQVGEDIANTAKGLNEESMNTLLKIFTTPASLLRQGATGRNPEFMIPNIIRDQLDASITSKYGYIPFVDYLSGLKSMLTKDDIYRKWEGSGAKIDLGEMSGRKSIQASFDAVKKKKRLSAWLGQALDTLGKYSEQPTRIGLFKRAYQKTGNEMIAMMESRDATVDFARMGSKMKVANSIIPFLNVGVQGFDKLIRETKNNPAKVMALGTLYGVMPAVSATLYNIMYHPEEYAEIPQYDKDANFVFIKGRNANGTVDYFTIPKGNVIPLIANPAEHFLSYMAGQDSGSFSEFATKFISSALPVIGDGSTPKEVAIKTIGSNLPQLIKPATEVLINKSFYKYDTNKAEAKEIVPYYMKDKPGYQQDYEFTPKMYKAIGAVLNISPLQIKNTMEGYLAGYVKIPAQVIQVLSDISEGKQSSPNDITLLRRFMKQTYETSAPKEITRPETPPLMERITGKVSASSGEDATNAKMKRLVSEIKKIDSAVNKGNMMFEAGEIKKQNRMDSYGKSQAEVDEFIAQEKANASYQSYQAKIQRYNKTKDPKAGSSLYYSVKNSKSLTPKMKEELLKEIPVPSTKTKTKSTSTKVKVRKLKVSKSKKAKIKKIKMPKFSVKLPKSKKIKVAKVKTIKMPKLSMKKLKTQRRAYA